MKISPRRLGIIGIIILVMLLLTLVFAPAKSKINSGSTYSRNPDGYGAWFKFMNERGTPLQRWQKPFSDLEIVANNPVTLLRIYPSLKSHSRIFTEKEWIEKGNTLIILGERQPATAAKFTTFQDSEVGRVKIETRRRKTNNINIETLLNDEFGAIVWSVNIGKGKLIASTTPYLAANAYQDYPANYEFLAQLVTKNNQSIWVDEYIHGYKDTEVIEEEIGNNAFSYLAQTPLILIVIQGIIILIILLWAENHRFGQIMSLAPAKVNNSRAYIEALAAVLRKAEQKQFLLEKINTEEQKKLQQQLGLGKIPLESHSLALTWSKTTGKPSQEVENLFKKVQPKRQLSDAELRTWLETWQKINNSKH